MIRTAAIIVRDSSPLRFAGLDLAERALRLARRAGVDQIRIVDDQHPFAIAPDAVRVLVLPERVLLEPAAIVDFLSEARRHGADVAQLADGAGEPTGVMLLSQTAFGQIRWFPRAAAAVHHLLASTPVTTIAVDHFVVRLRDARDLAPAEREYMAWTNGGDSESVWTRNIRALSIPVSRVLARRGWTPNQVTLAGFGLAIASAIAFAQGGYTAGLAGAALYWFSMVFDCSDGEVARATLADSKFGAWLETATDYLSYFVVLGGIVLGDAHAEGVCKHVVAAIVAAAASLAIVSIVGYLRARVASENPGGFDDALAADLKRGTATQRFAAWGRQLIKRSFVAHLIVFQAAIGFIPALTEIWAYGAVAALVVVVAVQSHIIRSVRPASLEPAAL